jgi:alginate O-acetyltransferase complex protein AlgI
MIKFFKKISATEKNIIQVWILSFLILISSYLMITGANQTNFLHVKNIVIYSLFSLMCATVLNFILFKNSKLIIYILFFLITFFSLFGLSKTLTGSHSESASLYLYGLSFYTVTLAYLSKINKLNIVNSFIAANPLLLITGPVATSFKVVRKKPIIDRFNYNFPYIVLGVFLHQIIATPLTQTFFLIKSPDLISTIIYSVIFEIFVYSNFCGLSLIIYGIFGLLGIRIPLNFKQPFSSTNLLEFWRGWHISFSTALKALFYNPIKRKFGSHVAILGVFLSSALWHGVSINFIWWGLFHAVCFSLTVILLRLNIKFIPALVLILAIPFARILSSDDNTIRLSTKLLFNFENFDALYFIYGMGSHVKVAIILGLLFIFSEIFFKKRKFFSSKNYKFYRIPAVQFGLLFLIILLINDQGSVYAVYGQR